MLTSTQLMEKINSHCYSQFTAYRFNKTSLQVSDKYRVGRLAGLDYIDKLTYYFIQQERRARKLFRDEILKQMQLNACLEDNDYKQGLYDALNAALDELIELEKSQENPRTII